MRRKFCRSALVLLATGALATSGAVLAQEQEQQEQQEQQEEHVPPQQQANTLPPGQVPAVLKAREAQFVYRSSSRLLTCEQVRNRVAVILRAVGARQDVQVRANECEAFIDPTQMTTPSRTDTTTRSPWDASSRSESTFDRIHPSTTDRNRTQSTPVHIELMMPVPVTAEILSQVDQDKARRELVSRVTGNPGAAMDDPIFFAAERRPVTLSYDTIRIESIDCELLEQMTQTVFRELDLKVTSQPLSCDKRQRSALRPQLTVEALLPVGVAMPGEKAPGEPPAKR
jgi:hypothetical protein